MLVGMKGYQGRVIVMLIVHNERRCNERVQRLHGKEEEKGPFFICFEMSDLLPPFLYPYFFSIKNKTCLQLLITDADAALLCFALRCCCQQVSPCWLPPNQGGGGIVCWCNHKQISVILKNSVFYSCRPISSITLRYVLSWPRLP